MQQYRSSAAEKLRKKVRREMEREGYLNVENLSIEQIVAREEKRRLEKQQNKESQE